jgi:hypothetical protein
MRNLAGLTSARQRVTIQLATDEFIFFGFAMWGYLMFEIARFIAECEAAIPLTEAERQCGRFSRPPFRILREL